MREREENAADVQESKQTQAIEGPRLPGPYEDKGRKEGPRPSSPQGTSLPLGERRIEPEAPPVVPRK